MISNPIRSTLTGDSDFKQILVEFISKVPKRLESIRKAMNESDTKNFCTLIHQLKGACGSYGFQELTPLASQLEAELRSGASLQSPLSALEIFIELCMRMTAESE
ncbi:MAG: Hpt domain-containing protein [Pirellula sp.]|jgi:HPt (histidine-containing phosphotransfer) domain-containing protein|nr:Hpt domain-containing protein [Pirellula sp.]